MRCFSQFSVKDVYFKTRQWTTAEVRMVLFKRLKSGAYAGVKVHWVHVHPPPPPNLGKKFRSEMSNRGEKVPPRYVGKKEYARSAQIPQN